MNSLMTIENVRGYLDPANGTAYLNAEDVARGFGFTQIKNGAEYIRWETVNGKRLFKGIWVFPTCWER